MVPTSKTVLESCVAKAIGTDCAPPRLWRSLDEVAFMLGVSKRTVRSWVSQGQLPVHRTSKRLVRIADDDLRKFVSKR